MGTKTPSKYLSLEYLLQLQSQDYCNKDRGIDYEPSEVDALIWKKQAKLDQLAQKKMDKEWYEYTLYQYKTRGEKDCSKCKQTKPFKDFSPDPSKKYFGLRSWCRKCRSKNSN